MINALASFRTAEQWHTWFTLQAGWTGPTRRWLYEQAGLDRVNDILEVGCGTGVITEEVARLSGARVCGLDIDADMLGVARRVGGAIDHVRGDAHDLPFSDGSYDLVLCHYLLLWLGDPVRAVREMARVLRPGGVALACAEPDYGGRIDHPPELVRLGRLQAEALRRQGAEPEVGRRLGELFCTAGLQTTVGVMAGSWEVPGRPSDDFAAEWAMRRWDLAGLLPAEELDRLEEIDRQALLQGRQFLFVPTLYAIGRKSK